MFLDISKAFDKVWHDGLLFKIKNYGISTVIKDFLFNCQQRVVLNGKSSCFNSWFNFAYTSESLSDMKGYSISSSIRQ